jgi:hypothetical protein
MTNGTELNTFITGLNGGATIDAALLNVLINTAKTIIEEERPWMILRKTDTSKTVTTAYTWQTAIDLSTITNFSRFYGEEPIRLFDGGNRVEYFRQIPFDRRLEYKDVSNTFCFDENSSTVYLNGAVPFNGTLYINHLISTEDIDVDSADQAWSPFPSRFLPLVGYYAIGIHMGGVDYDSITARQAPAQIAVMNTLKNALETWDNQRQLSAIEHNDPTELYGGYRSGAINRD